MNQYYYTTLMYNYLDVFGTRDLFSDDAQRIVNKLDSKSGLLADNNSHVIAVLTYKNYGYMLIFQSET